ncbi:MAG TPA: glutamine synthetase family protein [Paracoccaceae bacterium]|nr:glutamine synthetase family protein [Paracoccaceae bacterium]
MPGKLTLDELKQAVLLGEIDTVIAAHTDMQGRLMGKRFQAGFFLETAVEETHCCNYLLAVDMEMEPVPGYKSASWEQGYGDYVMRPDLSTLRRIPWLPGTALVLCDLLDHATHAEVPQAPRAILKRQIARLAAHGLTPMMATELEFFLFRDSYEAARAKGFRDLASVTGYNADYAIYLTSKEEEVMRAIRNGLNGADIPVENSKGEASIGQEEINIRYADALVMADRHAILKNGIKEIALQKGHAATFMAKWNYALAGSSAHIHQSLRNAAGAPAFHDPAAEHGMSELMCQYLAGLLHHAEAITLCLAPYINSYKRFIAGTFAPTRVCWSTDNRTAGFRVCGAGTKSVRVECRIGGADLNPYLALAGQIAAGLDGIENRRSLEPEFKGDAYAAKEVRQIPATLRDAMAAFERSEMVRAAFGGDVVEHYVHAARWEQFEYDRRVTDWEVHRGFERA